MHQLVLNECSDIAVQPCTTFDILTPPYPEALPSPFKNVTRNIFNGRPLMYGLTGKMIKNLRFWKSQKFHFHLLVSIGDGGSKTFRDENLRRELIVDGIVFWACAAGVKCAMCCDVRGVG